MMENVPRVGVILVNWRGWRDTLLSLETLFGGDYPAFDVVVVDNDSGDESVARIRSWAQGSERAVLPTELVGRVKAVAPLGVDDCVVVTEVELDVCQPTRAPLTILCAAHNSGFAAGNNLGFKYLQRLGGYDYFWLLNNDAFPAPEALSHLVARGVKDPTLGQIGATLVYSGRPDTVQAFGGAIYDPKSGRAYHLGAESSLSDLGGVSESVIEKRMSYVVGASILVSNSFLSRVGLMEESYFLYFEELDWAERGKQEFGLGYARDAVVYHKAGASTQSKSRRSALAAYYLAHNRVVVTRRFFPAYLTSVVWSLAVETLSYAAKARWSEARGFFRALRGSLWFAVDGGQS